MISSPLSQLRQGRSLASVRFLVALASLMMIGGGDSQHDLRADVHQQRHHPEHDLDSCRQSLPPN